MVTYAKIMETFESPGPPIAELGSRVCGTKTQTVRGERGAMKRRVDDSREAWCFIRSRGPVRHPSCTRREESREDRREVLH